MNKTALIYSKDEALAMAPKDRPICYRLPSSLYPAVFETVGGASMCWTPEPSKEVFNSEKAERLAVEL